jgi:HD-GYP domain-containing protein (c-di-GMP phosphodiesterase class II)
MKKVSVNQLQVNTYIDAPVYLDPKYIILSPETPITEELLQRLNKWNYEQVFTDGLPSGAPPSSGSAGSGESLLDQDIKDHEAEQQASNFFNEMVKLMDDIFRHFLEKGLIYHDSVIDVAKRIMEELKHNKPFLLSVYIPERRDVNYVVPHAVKTAVFALSVADFLKLPPHKQIDLGTAALLHEIGMLRIPPEVYQHDRKLTDKERQTIVAHPVISYKILKEADFPPAVCIAVLEHHEYVNGTGYPRKLSGDNISLYGKIVGVASAYAAATSKRPFREGLDGHTSIMDLAKEMGKRYDERVLRALVFTLSVYPIGTYVLMSNSARGVIVKTDPKEPKHPLVRLLVNENNTPYRDRPIVQPKDNDEVVIERPLTKSEVKALKQYIQQ